MREIKIIEYSFFRSIAIYAIVVLPVVISVALHTFSENFVIVENGYTESLVNLRDSLFQQYLQTYKLILIILLAFFLTYRWSVMERNGSYGYWLTQGMSRERYFVVTFSYFSLLTFATWIIGIFYIRYLLGVQLLGTEIANIIVLLFFNSLFITAFTIFIGEILTNSEIAFILTVSLLGGVLFLVEILPTFIHYLILPELFFKDNIALPVLFSTLGTIVIIGISFGFHKNSDIEL